MQLSNNPSLQIFEQRSHLVLNKGYLAARFQKLLACAIHPKRKTFAMLKNLTLLLILCFGFLFSAYSETLSHKDYAAKLQQRIMDNAAWLKENAKRETVTSIKGSIQIEHIEEGWGPAPKFDNKVVVRYKGMLIDGTVFEDTTAEPEPITFALDGIIPGLTEGLMLMRVGGIARIYIPSRLGYGSKGSRKIPAYSAVIFEISLIDVK